MIIRFIDNFLNILPPIKLGVLSIPMEFFISKDIKYLTGN